MARKPTRDELVESLLREQSHNMALSLFIRQLCPAAGWHFVTGPRGYSAFLIQTDVEGRILSTITIHDKGSAEWSVLEGELYRASESEGELLLSFLDASREAHAWRSGAMAGEPWTPVARIDVKASE